MNEEVNSALPTHTHTHTQPPLTTASNFEQIFTQKSFKHTSTDAHIRPI